MAEARMLKAGLKPLEPYTNTLTKWKCPACGVKVPVGVTLCQKCSFDFKKQAGV